MPATDHSGDRAAPTEPVSLPPEIDTRKASIARVYDAFLGGKDNYEVDQQVMRHVLDFAPESSRTAKQFRAWLIRVARFLVGSAEMDQFLDIGSGLPTAENTHQAVQRLNPEAHVVYVDNDPIVAAHGRALLEENEYTRFVVADLRDPEALFNDPVVARHLDRTRPFALIHCATIHHVDDDERPYELMQAYIDALPSGSYLALSHFHDPEDGGELSELAHSISDTFRDSSMGTGWFRTRKEILSFFDGMELIEPGLTELHNWWPDGPRIKDPVLTDYLVLGAVARKP